MADQGEFGRLLDRLIHERCRTASRFCELTGLPASQVSRFISGERPIPKDQLGVWAKALGLSKADAEDFIVEGELSDAPVARKRLQTLAARVQEQDRAIYVLNIKVETLSGLHRPDGSPGRPASR